MRDYYKKDTRYKKRSDVIFCHEQLKEINVLNVTDWTYA